MTPFIILIVFLLVVHIWNVLQEELTNNKKDDETFKQKKAALIQRIRDINADTERIKAEIKLIKGERRGSMHSSMLPVPYGFGYNPSWIQQTEPVVDLAEIAGDNSRAMEMFSNELAKNTLAERTQESVPHLTELAKEVLRNDPSAREVEVTDAFMAGAPVTTIFGREKVRNPVRATRTITVRKS